MSIFGFSFVAWYLGTIVAARLAGRFNRNRTGDEAAPEYAVAVFILLWPVWVVCSPVIAAYMAGVKPRKK